MRNKWKEVSVYTGMEEDAPANSAGGGNVHGIGVGPHGEPGVHPKKKKKEVLIDREGRLDGRTKAYREHRKKLEQARIKRQENRKSSKFIEDIKNKTTEMAYGAGYDTAKPMAAMNPNPKVVKKKKK